MLLCRRTWSPASARAARRAGAAHGARALAVCWECGVVMSRIAIYVCVECAARTPRSKRNLAMARAIWKGAISFGLVNIPVELYPAEDASRSSSRCSTSATSRPVGYKRYSKKTNKEVEWSNIVKGYEYEKDQYVVLSDEDFRRANVKATQTIDIQAFVAGGRDSRRILRVALLPRARPPADRRCTRCCAKRCVRRSASPSRKSSFAPRSTSPRSSSTAAR